VITALRTLPAVGGDIVIGPVDQCCNQNTGGGEYYKIRGAPHRVSSPFQREAVEYEYAVRNEVRVATSMRLRFVQSPRTVEEELLGLI